MSSLVLRLLLVSQCLSTIRLEKTSDDLYKEPTLINKSWYEERDEGSGVVNEMVKTWYPWKIACVAVGGVLGMAIIILAIITGAVCCLCRKRRRIQSIINGDVIIKSHSNSDGSYLNPLEINEPTSLWQQMDRYNERGNSSHEDDNVYQPLVNANRDYLSIYFGTYLPEIRIKEASNSVDEPS